MKKKQAIEKSKRTARKPAECRTSLTNADLNGRNRESHRKVIGVPSLHQRGKLRQHHSQVKYLSFVMGTVKNNVPIRIKSRDPSAFLDQNPTAFGLPETPLKCE